MTETILTLYCPLIFLIAINSGLLGSFVLWKKYSNMSESISHFSVLGATISFLFSYNMNLMIFITSVIYVALLYMMRKRFSSDTLVALFANIGLALALVLSAFFNKVRVDFMSLLFGDILLANQNDLISLSITTFIILVVTIFNWKKIILTILNADLAKSKSINTSLIDFFIITSIVAYITIAVKIIGAILLSSMLILPAATASMVTSNPKRMVLLSMVLSLLSQITGMLVSLLHDLSTSGSIALCSFVIFCVLGIFATLKTSLSRQ